MRLRFRPLGRRSGCGTWRLPRDGTKFERPVNVRLLGGRAGPGVRGRIGRGGPGFLLTGYMLAKTEAISVSAQPRTISRT